MAGDIAVKDSKKSTRELLLPIYRVRTIMKSSPDVENISQDALTAITAATVCTPTDNNFLHTQKKHNKQQQSINQWLENCIVTLVIDNNELKIK